METTARVDFDIATLPDYRWNPAGYSSFGGQLQQLQQNLDGMFNNWAMETGAVEYKFPVFIEARELNRIDYFQSFPHLVTFAACPPNIDSELQALAERPFTTDGAINLTATAPISQVLTPATCYHFYVQFQGQTIAEPKYVTACAQCFRRESQYIPLQRQWNFYMREIVCLGTKDQVQQYLASFTTKLARFFEDLELPVAFAAATDPFFNPRKNPKYLMQKLDPVKTELLFNESLSVGSINFHHNHFGEAFGIATADGGSAYSGCVAFGLERWMHMYLSKFGLMAPDTYPFPRLP
jgi:seryl-tRNA synthetase